MKKCILSFLIVCAFINCTPEEKRIPNNILPVSKMKLIVWDMIQAGAYESFLKEKDSASKNLNTAYLTSVLKMHSINKADFFKSFNFYQMHPALNKELFDSVSAYAQRQRMEIYRKRK